MFLTKFDLFSVTVVEPKVKKQKFHVIAIGHMKIVSEDLKARNEVEAKEKAISKLKIRGGEGFEIQTIKVFYGTSKTQKMKGEAVLLWQSHLQKFFTNSSTAVILDW